MFKKSLLNCHVIAVSILLGMLAFSQFIHKPQQLLVINQISEFKNTFSIFITKEQKSSLKLLFIVLSIDIISFFLLLKWQINQLRARLFKINGLLLLATLVLIIILTLIGIALRNGYHIYLYNMSNKIQWGLILISIIRIWCISLSNQNK